jgi:hypothetical protein
MSLLPTCSITLGELRYDSHAAELSVTLSVLPGVNSFAVDLPPGATVSCHPGDPARLDVDGGDDDGETTIMVGTVRSVSQGLSRIRVIAADASADLAALRSAATFTGQAGADVVTRLAGEAGVSVGDTDLDLPLGAYTAHQRQTAAEHIAYLAALGGAVAVIDADNRLVVRPRPSGPADVALLYGRELIECSVRDFPVRAAAVPIGNGPAGSADAPNVLRLTATPLPADAAAPGADARWIAAPVLRTPAVAAGAGKAYARARAVAS